MKFKRAYVVIVIGLILQMLFYAFMIGDDSAFSTYDKYASGEYYFLARAKTTQPDDSLLYDTTIDTSKTKNILLLSSGAEVIAYNMHGPYCTVVYGDEVVEDFPYYRLKFLTDDDKDIFFGKTYTEEEYNALLKKIMDDPSMEKMLSDKKMLPGKKDFIFPVVVVVYSLAMAIALFLLRDDSMWSEIILTIWVLLSILFDIIYTNATMI